MSLSPYSYSFDIDDNSTAAHVVRNVGCGKYVLELGCAYGVMTKVLVEHNDCRVFGIEYDENSAQDAKEYCEDLAILDIENANWDKVLGDKRFDVIVAADVLEHLLDPKKVLESLKKFLAPNGYVVVSLPNVAHNGIIAELLNEDFRYRETGLLDATHLRFWGANGIKRLLLESGYAISNAEKTRMEAGLSEFADSWSSLPEWLAIFLASRPDGDVYQYIVKAFPSENASEEKLISWPDKPVLPGFEEVDKKIQHLTVKAENAEKLSEDQKLDIAGLLAEIQHLKNSKSWRITSPLRFFMRLIHCGFLDEDKQRISRTLRKTYHRLPLPVAVKRLISLIYHRGVMRFVRAIKRRLFRVGAFHAPSIFPVKQSVGLPDYIVWGVVDWHFRHQRPQQLALALASTGRRVFYISPDLQDDERAGFNAETLDDSGLLFQINLFIKNAPQIYVSVPGLDTVTQLRSSIGEVLAWANGQQVVSLVQHPFWFDAASVLPNSRLVYDCMDHHEGFSNTVDALVQQEKILLMQADLTVTTSDWLDQAVEPHVRRRALIRNAADYEYFSREPENIYSDPQGRRIIGYYGAIAEWFDLDLVESIAKQYPECCVLLIGADTVNARGRLDKLPNVTFTGEVPYNKIPYYLYSFDICLLPFKVIPLTIATNPVKVYEYLSAGKPVVAVDLPEMSQFDGLVNIAADKEHFLAEVNSLLMQTETSSMILNRKKFAAGQTWAHRTDALIEQVESTTNDPMVSVVVVTYNNLELTRACLDSLNEYCQYANLEIIVVDNASSDTSPEFLKEWASHSHNRRLILNDDNRGFAAANNQGLKIASGDYLVMLNNDTYVTPGWIRTLFQHLQRDKTIGLIGPVTNNIGNEAKIDIAYNNMSEMLTESAAYTNRHVGQLYPLRTAAFFCVMMSQDTYQNVGPLDEAFGRGFFEDDDYCRRIEVLGQRIACAEDVFVHHQLSASFNKLGDKKKKELFDKNKAVYEKKWGEWLPHRQR